MSWLGLDIGGANLKAADGRGWAQSVPFPLWRSPDDLSNAIGKLIQEAPHANRLAVTMTGELADCFRTKVEGVHQILAAVREAADGRSVLVYLVDGRFVSIEEARESPRLAAASNWHALASFACQFVERSAAVLIDIGSTTSDIIPILEGRPCARGRSDTERLLSGELVYTGVGRTPICAVTHWLPLNGERCPIAAEVFATTADAYVLMGKLPPQVNATWTADGRPLTLEFCLGRMARMFCADIAEMNAAQMVLAATRVEARQQEMLRWALAAVASRMERPPQRFVLAGAGEFLAREVVQRIADDSAIVSLNKSLGEAMSECAPAHALAVLARECTRLD